METFFKQLIKYKLLILTLFTIIVVFGYKAYRDIPVDAFPDITPKQVVIYTESPGNSAKDIEKLITYPIESSLSGLPGIKSIMSNSLFGLSYVSVFFDDAYDIYFLRRQVLERLQNVDIPKGWGKPSIGPNTTGLGQILWYRLRTKDSKFSLTKLRELQDYVITPMFKSVNGVEEVIGWGGFKKQYEVLIEPKRLQALGITYQEIVEALSKSNQVAGGQYLEFNKEQYLIRGVGLLKNLEDIKNVVVKAEDAKAVTIKDLAEVKVAKEMRFGAVTVDAKEAVFGMVLQRSGTNAAKVVEKLKERILLINATLPKGIEIEIIYDRSNITRKAIDTMKNALIGGSILVVAVLVLFLFEIRSAFIVVLSLPFSIFIAFLLMKWFEISANLMSLSGLAIAIGMIVDATIVVVENNFRLIHENKNDSLLEIISKGTKEVVKPVIFALLVIMAIFIPLLSLEGLAGKLYSPMAMNIVFVMIGSLVVALIMVPIVSFLFLKPTRHRISPFMIFIKKIYSPVLTFCLKYTKSIITLISFIFFILLYQMSMVGKEFIPKLNEESIMYRVIAIPGTSLSQNVKNSKEIEKYILKNYDEVKSVLAMIGRSEKGETAQSNYMEILLTLNEGIDIERLDDKITEDLSKKFAYIQFVPTQPIAMRIEELLEGIQAELAIKIFGEDQKKLNIIAADIKKALENIRGLKHIETESQLGQAEIKIIPNFLALARYGITIEDIMQLIRKGIGEEKITEKIEGIKRFGVVAKLKNAKKNIDSLKNTMIRSKSGKMVKLLDICNIEILQGPSFIKRENLNRYMVISMEVENRDIASFVKEANEIIKKDIKLPVGYYISWAGDFKNMQEAQKKLMIIIPSTILLIILLLYTAFNSLKKALLILIGIPLGLIGGMIAIFIGDIYLSVSAIIGFIIIFAIAVLNGIVLVSFIDQLREKFPHVKLIDLLKEATLLRLRPVLMTASTTLFGILPLLFVKGVGSEIQYPLSVVVTGGIISSTILTLLVLPGFYLLFFKNEHK